MNEHQHHIVKLGQISNISYGCNLNAKIKNLIDRLQPGISIDYLVSSSFTKDGGYKKTSDNSELSEKDFLDFYTACSIGDLSNISPILEKHRVYTSDVIVQSKGGNFFASIVGPYEKSKENFIIPIASTLFLVVRLSRLGEGSKFSILPEFLKLLLNSERYQKILQRSSLGNNTGRVITISTLQNLEIVIPPLTVQQTAIKIINERNNAKRISKEIDALIDKEIEIKLFQSFLRNT